MRELKFRVWDNLKKEWLKKKVYHSSISLNESGIGEFVFKQHPEGYTIQQYIGLKDCNNVEIYEGDIVSYEAGEPNRNDGSFYRSISEVKFENGAFWPRPMKEECEDSWYDYELKNICIIGNTFETPELLSAKQLLR